MRRFAVAALSGALALAASADARGDEADAKRACAADHERTQRLHLAGKLLDARGAALACAQEGCPAVVRAECVRLLAELDAVLPSIVIEVRDADGGEVSQGVDVELDGAQFGQLDPRAITLDPGEHVLRVVTSAGLRASQTLAVREGQLRRAVRVELPRPAPEAPRAEAPPPSGPPAAPAQGRAAEAPRATPWPVFALGGVGLAALGSFAFFGLRGYREEVSLESSCAPRCAPGSDDAMRRDYLVADIALAAGVLSLGAATWLYFARDSSGRAAAAR